MKINIVTTVYERKMIQERGKVVNILFSFINIAAAGQEDACTPLWHQAATDISSPSHWPLLSPVSCSSSVGAFVYICSSAGHRSPTARCWQGRPLTLHHFTVYNSAIISVKDYIVVNWEECRDILSFYKLYTYVTVLHWLNHYPFPIKHSCKHRLGFSLT